MSEKKQIFRKDFVDIVAILPSKEGKVELGTDNYVTMRVAMNLVTDIEAMSKIFRQLWVNLARQDKTLKPEFETFFKNEAIAKKRAEKLLAKMAIKGDEKKMAKLEKKVKEYEIKQSKTDKETKISS